MASPTWMDTGMWVALEVGAAGPFVHSRWVPHSATGISGDARPPGPCGPHPT